MQMAKRVGWLSLLLPALLAFESDPGLVVELDLETFALKARDLRSDAAGPEFAVVTGSPSHRTPAGDFAASLVVHNPAWKPGDTARSYGADPIPPSVDGPLGIGKIPFAGDGIALHGGADPLLLGKPVSLGCVRVLDPDFARLVGWFQDQGALRAPVLQADGEVHQRFGRRVRIVVTR